MTTSTLAGFQVIPAAYPNSTHYLYVKSHTSIGQGHYPDGRTLFVVNIPPDATERDLLRFFKSAGTIEKVIFNGSEKEPENDATAEEVISPNVDANPSSQISEQDNDPPRKKRKVFPDTDSKSSSRKITPLPKINLRVIRRTGGSAHVIFLDSSSLDRALNMGSATQRWLRSSSKSGEITSEDLVGLARYSALYDALRPPMDIIREHADTSMEAYEHELRQSKQHASHRKGDAIIDEDGFELVTRGGAYGKTLGGGVAVASKKFQTTGMASRVRKPKSKQNDKEGFYTFQKAEKQRKGLSDRFAFPVWILMADDAEIIELKKNWEADKAKVEKLKEARKFKPY